MGERQASCDPYEPVEPRQLAREIDGGRALLEAVVAGLASARRPTRRRTSTHASIQHMNAKLRKGPTRGSAPRAKETPMEVRTITARYAEVANMVSMPVYVPGCGGGTARLPCCSRKARLAMRLHHEFCPTKKDKRVVSDRRRGTADVEVEGECDDGEEPEDFVAPADVATEPGGVVVHEGLEEHVEGVDRRQRQRVEEERLEEVGADLGVAGGQT